MSSTVTVSPEDEPVLYRREGAVAYVTLNRPAQYNALTRAMLEAMITRLESVASDAEVQVLVLEAQGRAFCAGHDFREVRDTDDTEVHRSLFDTCSRMMMTLHRLPQPVVAKVQGLATGAGCQLVAACDLAVAGEEARLATSGINVGLFCSTPSVEVGRNLAPKHALEMLLTGDFVDARTAERLGLVNRVVPMAELDAETCALAEHIAGKPTPALRLAKRTFYTQMGMGIDEAYRFASGVMAENLADPETRERIDAFLEKRPPRC